MGLVDPDTQTAFATYDWEQYKAGRPAYPASLQKLILDHHAAHGGGRHRMVDIGAGVGIASIGLAPSFEVVHVSDPSPDNVRKAPAFLAQYAPGVRVETSIAVGEDAFEHLAPQSVDLVICGTAAHFMDGERLVASVARMLRPGGTLAIFSYLFLRFPGKSRALQCAFDACVVDCINSSIPPDNELAHRIFRQVGANFTAGDAALDYIPVTQSLFAHPVRYRINIDETSVEDVKLLWECANIEIQPTQSRVAPADTVYLCTSPEDAAAEGWTMHPTKNWLYDHLTSMRGPDRAVTYQDRTREPFCTWEALFDQECPDGTAEVVFPAALVMGTRK